MLRGRGHRVAAGPGPRVDVALLDGWFHHLVEATPCSIGGREPLPALGAGPLVVGPPPCRPRTGLQARPDTRRRRGGPHVGRPTPVLAGRRHRSRGFPIYVGDPDAYRNPDHDSRLHFLGFGPEAVEWLLERRYIRAIGVDPLSPDPGASTTFELQRRLLAADRCGLENLANLQHIAPRGTEAIIGVAPWE